VKSQLEDVRRSFDASAASGHRMLAIHFTEDGKALDESVYDAIYRHVDGLLHFQPEDVVLEVGAGSGLLLERIARRVARAHGTDLSAEILKLIPRAHNLEVQPMPSDSLSFADASFDKVVLNAVIQFFPDRQYAARCLAELVRVCRPGGAIYIGDVFNAYLEREYLEEGQQAPPLRERFLGLVRRLLGQPTGGYRILFLYPHEIGAWAGRLGCRECRALLSVDETKPYLFRKFRYDVLISR
jgi:SAM-dependent methyltransferase